MKLYHGLLVILISLFALPAKAEFTVGEQFPSVALEDQFDDQIRVEASHKLVLMSFEMEVSEQVNAFLAARDSDFLTRHHSRYIADISAMPGLITRMFALPKMRDYNYRLMLIKEEDIADSFRQEKGKLMVYRLEEHTIVAIEALDPAELDTLFVGAKDAAQAASADAAAPSDKTAQPEPAE